MRNTLQEQYNLLKEGKGNKQQFFKSARQLFPNLVTPINTYEDTVRILKNRGIITEGIGGVVTKGKTPDWHSIFKENINSLNELERTQMGMYLMFNKKTGKLENYMESPDHKENNTLKKQIEDQGSYVLHFITGNDYNKFKDNLNKFKGKTKQELDLSTNNLKEAKEAKAEEKETTKEVTDMATRGYDYKDYKNIDNIFGEAFLKGFYTEMGDPKNEGKTVEELRQIVAKNMAKDCLHYTKDGQFGIKGVGYTVDAPGLGESKPAKGPHKSSGYGDLKESVLRSQIYLLVKEVLTEEKSKSDLKVILNNLKKALAIAEEEINKVDKDGKPLLDKNGKAFKEFKKTIADKKREIEAVEKEIKASEKKPLTEEDKKSKDEIEFKTTPKEIKATSKEIEAIVDEYAFEGVVEKNKSWDNYGYYDKIKVKRGIQNKSNMEH